MSATGDDLRPVHDSIGFARHVALDVADEPGKTIDVGGAEEHVEMSGEPAEGIELNRVELLGAGHPKAAPKRRRNSPGCPGKSVPRAVLLLLLLRVRRFAEALAPNQGSPSLVVSPGGRTSEVHGRS